MRALIVSYAFPPVGGAGVQRVLKLVKYLPAHGVTPTVLTVENPSVPLRDESLAGEVPPEARLLRAKTLEPSYATKQVAWRAQSGTDRSALARGKARLLDAAKLCLVPDPQVLWLPAASRALISELGSRQRPDVVLVSGPPFSTFLLGALARAFPGVAVVLDYRDEWTTTRAVYEMSGAPAARVGAWLEPRLLRRAHAVTTATEAFREELLARFDFLDPARVRTIENGFDEADFPAVLPEPPRDRCVLTYAGTVFRLTSARSLVEAVRLLHERDPELARLLEVRFIGRIVDTEASYFEGSEAVGIRRLGYLEHRRVIDELARSHAALCLLDDVPGAERIYPAKIFELMRIGRPCLVLAPEGALAALARKHGLGDVIAPRDVEAISNALARTVTAFRDTGRAPAFEPRGVERFDRRRQAGDFAELFGFVLDRARTSGRAHPDAATAVGRAAAAEPL